MGSRSGHLMARRRHKSKGDIEAEILRGRWPDFSHNESLHSAADNHHARRRCRQLIDGGPDAIDWNELFGQK